MSDEIVWEDPGKPAKGRSTGEGPSVWEKRLQPLLDRPGDWARVMVYDTPAGASAVAVSLRISKLRKPPVAKAPTVPIIENHSGTVPHCMLLMPTPVDIRMQAGA